MKQKYVLTKSGENETLTISEYTEIEKKTFSLICEESHDGEVIRNALTEGVDRLIATFRTHNMYPRIQYAREMATGIVEMFQSAKDAKKEFVFDDMDTFKRATGNSTGGLDGADAVGESILGALLTNEDDEGIDDVDLDDVEVFDDSEAESPDDEF